MQSRNECISSMNLQKQRRIHSPKYSRCIQKRVCVKLKTNSDFAIRTKQFLKVLYDSHRMSQEAIRLSKYHTHLSEGNPYANSNLKPQTWELKIGEHLEC